MSVLNLRRFDVQAKWSVSAAGLGLLPLAAALFGLMRRYNADLRAFQYGADSLFMPIFLGCIATTCLLAAAAIILGFNSAGQRRNDVPGWSWVGFFAGTAVLSASLLSFTAFWTLRLPVLTGSP